jgi:hypothetical protein
MQPVSQGLTDLIHYSQGEIIMIPEPPSRAWIPITAAIIGGFCVVVAAIIALGEPFVEHIAEQYYPSHTQTPVIIYHPGGTTSTPFAPGEPPANPAPLVQPTQAIPTALLVHQIETVGSGVFSQASYSDGSASYSQAEISGSHSRIQMINPDTTSNGCGIAYYNADVVWFSAARKSTLLLNGTPVGETYLGLGNHGYMIALTVKIGDELCIEPVPEDGFHINLGPDIYYHYDSYCFRGNCD